MNIRTALPQSRHLVTDRSAHRQSLLQQLDKVTELSHEATRKKIAGPHREVVPNQGRTPLTISFEVNKEGQHSALFLSGKTRLSIEEVKGLREVIRRLDSFVGQLKK